MPKALPLPDDPEEARKVLANRARINANVARWRYRQRPTDKSFSNNSKQKRMSEELDEDVETTKGEGKESSSAISDSHSLPEPTKKEGTASADATIANSCGEGNVAFAYSSSRMIVQVIAPKGPMKLTLRRVVDDSNSSSSSNNNNESKRSHFFVHDVDAQSSLTNKVYKGDVLLSIDGKQMQTMKDIADHTKATNHCQRVLEISRSKTTTTTTTTTAAAATTKPISSSPSGDGFATQKKAASSTVAVTASDSATAAETSSSSNNTRTKENNDNINSQRAQTKEDNDPSNTTTTTNNNNNNNTIKSQQVRPPDDDNDPSRIATTSSPSLNTVGVSAGNPADTGTSSSSSSTVSVSINNTNINENQEPPPLLQPQQQLEDDTESGTMVSAVSAEARTNNGKNNNNSNVISSNFKVLNSMSKIIKSPYEKEGNESAEVGEHEFEIVKQHFQTKSAESVEIFGAGLATNVVKATNQIGISGQLYDTKWNQTGKIRGVQFGWLPNAVMLLLLFENRLLKPDEAVLSTIVKDLGVSRIIWDALKEYNLQYTYPKLFASMTGFAFQRQKLVSMKCAIFAARAYRCVVLLSPKNQVLPSGTMNKKKRREMSDSLYQKFKRCCEIMNDNIKVNEKGLNYLQNEMKRQNLDSSLVDAHYPTQTSTAKRRKSGAAEKRSSSSSVSEQPPRKKQRGRSGRGRGSEGRRQQQQSLSLDSVSSSSSSSSLLLEDNLDPTEREKYRQMRDTFEMQYKQMGEDWKVMSQRLKIRNDKRRVAEIRKELLEELKNK